MGSSTRLTEETVRSLSTARSFDRGLGLFEWGVIYDGYRQENTIYAKCKGQSAPYYTLKVVMMGDGVQAAECDCPYRYGGICKHLVALLLTEIHHPERFEVRPIGIERGQWPEPDRAALPGLQKPLSDISDKPYRRRIKAILREPLSVRHSQQYWMTGRMVAELEIIRQEALQDLAADDSSTALVILMALLEETAEAYLVMDDSDGKVAHFLYQISESLSEAILSRGFSDEDRQMLRKRLSPLAKEFRGYEIYGIEEALESLDEGWGAALSLDHDDD